MCSFDARNRGSTRLPLKMSFQEEETSELGRPIIMMILRCAQRSREVFGGTKQQQHRVIVGYESRARIFAIFEQNHKSYKTLGYNEGQVRREFLDQFLRHSAGISTISRPSRSGHQDRRRPYSHPPNAANGYRPLKVMRGNNLRAN